MNTLSAGSVAALVSLAISTGSHARAQTPTYYDVTIPSPVAGESVPFTVFLPEGYVPGESYPLVLTASGFAQARTTEPNGELGALSELAPLGSKYGDVSAILEAGMGVIAFDHRGQGDSDGDIDLMDPATAGPTLLAILDWAEQHLDWLAYENGNLVLGATGGSYGGAYQWLLAAIDPKKRLDAMVPQITWHDLSRSLAPSGVPKSAWLSLFWAASYGSLSPELQDSLEAWIDEGNVPDADLDMLRSRSLVAYCDGDLDAQGMPLPPPPAVDTLLLQGNLDVLFDLNEAYASYECLSSTGADVRMATYQYGHILPLSPAILDPIPWPLDNFFGCGGMTGQELEVAWLRAKLKGETGLIENWSRLCLTVDGSGESVGMDDFPRGGDTFALPSQTISTGLLGASSRIVSLWTADASTLIAGIPTARLRIADPWLGTWAWGDPIVFVALGKNGYPIDDQVLPVRGYGWHDIDLKGVVERLDPGDELQLLYYATHPQYFSADNDPLLPRVKISGEVRVPLGD